MNLSHLTIEASQENQRDEALVQKVRAATKGE